jgi:hypothetical protein
VLFFYFVPDTTRDITKMLRYSLFTKISKLRNTSDVTNMASPLQSVLGVSAVNVLVTFYEERVRFFSFLLS